MLELKIGLVDVSTLNFDESLLQFNGKKKIKKCEETSRFELNVEY